MDDISLRIRRVTEDLRAIQRELAAATRRDPTAAQQAQLLDQLLSFDLVKDFKAAVDQMRHFLWAYIEAASHNRGSDPDTELQSIRMQRITEMLRLLAQDGDLSVPRAEARTFFEQVQEIAQRAVERHSNDENRDK